MLRLFAQRISMRTVNTLSKYAYVRLKRLVEGTLGTNVGNNLVIPVLPPYKIKHIEDCLNITSIHQTIIKKTLFK